MLGIDDSREMRVLDVDERRRVLDLQAGRRQVADVAAAPEDELARLALTQGAPT